MADTWAQRLQRTANRLLNPVGLHLIRTGRAFEMDGLLARAAARNLNIRTWIDIGASDGSWSLQAHRHFPDAQFLLFEPLAALAALQQRMGFHVVHAAAGEQQGQVAFSIDPKLDGSGIAAPSDAGARTIPVETVDHAISGRGLPPSYALKLDTHGFELPVLKGASHVLDAATLLIIEAYNFPLVPGCLRFHELCAWLEPRGFRCCDLADPMRRPGDGALWQMDLAIARATSPLFVSNRYH
jgi:FkbM family methyltransferase